jgi:hypothetical protein
VAYSSAGVPLWTNLYGPGNALAMGVDNNGNVFVTGQGGVGNIGYATLKYSSSITPGLSSLYLEFQRLGAELVLSWTNSSFHLQSAPAITATFTNIADATSPYTNSLGGSQGYFRLSAP